MCALAALTTTISLARTSSLSEFCCRHAQLPAHHLLLLLVHLYCVELPVTAPQCQLTHLAMVIQVSRVRLGIPTSSLASSQPCLFPEDMASL